MVDVYRFAYVVSLLTLGLFNALFVLMDFQSTVIGIRDCVSCEANPRVRELYISGGPQALYHEAYSSVEFFLAVALFGVGTAVFSDMHFWSGWKRVFLRCVSFAVFVFLLLSAWYHLLPVYNNLWALYYLGGYG